MKKTRMSEKALEAYGKGYTFGVECALANDKPNMKKSNPFSAMLNRVQWEAFNNGLSDGYVAGVRKREQYRAASRLREIEKFNQSRGERDR